MYLLKTIDSFQPIMYKSFVTTAPTPGWAGDSRGMSGTLTSLSWQCGGNTRGLLYIGKKGREMKIEQAAFAGPKVKVPAIPWGVGAVVTND